MLAISVPLKPMKKVLFWDGKKSRYTKITMNFFFF